MPDPIGHYIHGVALDRTLMGSRIIIFLLPYLESYFGAMATLPFDLSSDFLDEII
jgi:hypothetical protein